MPKFALCPPTILPQNSMLKALVDTKDLERAGAQKQLQVADERAAVRERQAGKSSSRCCWRDLP
jgi:hypothetical protein